MFCRYVFIILVMFHTDPVIRPMSNGVAQYKETQSYIERSFTMCSRGALEILKVGPRQKYTHQHDVVG